MNHLPGPGPKMRPFLSKLRSPKKSLHNCCMMHLHMHLVMTLKLSPNASFFAHLRKLSVVGSLEPGN
jgi:hypothetical protein